MIFDKSILSIGRFFMRYLVLISRRKERLAIIENKIKLTDTFESNYNKYTSTSYNKYIIKINFIIFYFKPWFGMSEIRIQDD